MRAPAEEARTKNPQPATPDYPYLSAHAGHTAAYLWPIVTRILTLKTQYLPRPVRVLDLGAGNGAFAAHLAAQGFDVTAVEPSASGAAIAREAHPNVTVLQASAYDDLASMAGRFAAVTCLEVVEHCYYPRRLAETLYDLLEPSGVAVVSTPFHGYWKNLLLAVTGKMDSHFTALWDHGHIKFWSIRTLTQLLREARFRTLRIHRAGRLPIIAMSMIAVAEK